MRAWGRSVLCYWCQARTRDPWVIAWMDGERLCADCAGRYYDGVENGEPPRPNARCHMAKYLTHRLLPLRDDAAAARHIASFLEHPFRPGSGSRRTPAPCTRRIPERLPGW